MSRMIMLLLLFGCALSAISEERPALIHLVAPVYPYLAVDARLQGKTVASIAVTKEGKVSQVTIVSGHPIFAKAVISALGEWRFDPGNEERSLQITCVFELYGCDSETRVAIDPPYSLTVTASPKCVHIDTSLNSLQSPK